MKKYAVFIFLLLCLPGLTGCRSARTESGGDPIDFGVAALPAPHRADFVAGIEPAAAEQLGPEGKKAYLLLTSDWFLSGELSDFSQAVTTDAFYVAPGGAPDETIEAAYSTYKMAADGTLQWSSSAFPADNITRPFGFDGLSYDVIESGLADTGCEDYIITYSQPLGTVFVWARCEGGDLLLTYPTRPDLLGLAVGGLYTPKEVQAALSLACGP